MISEGMEPWVCRVLLEELGPCFYHGNPTSLSLLGLMPFALKFSWVLRFYPIVLFRIIDFIVHLPSRP